MAALHAILRCLQLAGYFLRFGLELLIRRPKSRRARAEWLHRFCLAAITGLRIDLVAEGTYPEHGAVVANHLSYLDIIVFAALHPCVFCSKAEIAHWPIIGWMTTMSGTVYVERGRGGSAAEARSGMTAAIDAGLPVVFFPEGTTSNGDTLLPFHSGLLAQALATAAPITAAYIRYTLTGSNGPGTSARDQVCWGDDTPLPKHAFRLLGLRGIHCTVRFAAEPIAFSSPHLHRKLAALEAHDAVLALTSAGSPPAATP